MIQSIFKQYNTTKLSGHDVVTELLPHVGLPEIAEAYIGEMLKAGTLIQEGKNLILNLPKETPEPVPEPVQTEQFSNAEIKKGWFQLRQMEKKDMAPTKFKIFAQSFVKKYGWNYYILNKKLREECEALGYHSEPAERSLFQREVLQKN